MDYRNRWREHVGSPNRFHVTDLLAEYVQGSGRELKTEHINDRNPEMCMVAVIITRNMMKLLAHSAESCY